MKIDSEGISDELLSKIKEIFETTLDYLEEDKENVGVGVFFTSEDEIKRLNKEYRGIDKVTDVLSFPMLEKTITDKISMFSDCADPDDNVIYLGDIIICEKKAEEQALDYNHSFKREVCFLALHGFLHLLGYDHIEKEDEVVMSDLAEKILLLAKVSRDD